MILDEGDIVIVGGGIIGLSIAHYLTEESAGKIIVLDREEPASQASKGNAGVISYMGTISNRTVLRPMINLSLKLFGELSQRVNFDFKKAGSIMLPQPQDGDLIHRLVKAYANEGVTARAVGGRELRELSPLLDPRVTSAVLFPDEARGNPAKLSEELVMMLADTGCNLNAHTMVTGFEVNDDIITAVKTLHGMFRVRNSVVLAAGAWSHSLAETVGVNVPVEPAKGHMVSFRAIPQRLGPTVLGKDIVVVQSSDGKVRSGGFVDMAGFDNKPASTRIRDVLERTFSLLPGLHDCDLIEEWAGLRPRTPDELPILGRALSPKNLFIATGHFKKGFCLSQATGLLISELIMERKPSLSLAPFRPERFGGLQVKEGRDHGGGP